MPPPEPVLDASESGIRLVCARFLYGKMAGRDRTGGEKRIIGGGVQNRFWRGVLWYHVTGNVCITVIINFPGINFGITLHSLYRKLFSAEIILLYIPLS